MTAITIFTIGTLICSLAQNFTLLLVGRSIQGAGGGGIVALTYVIVSDIIPLRERGKWFGVISLQWAIGSAVGPVLGGVFAEGDWRWIFWINLPFCIVGLVGIPVCLRLQKRKGEVWERLKAFDLFGAMLFVGGLTTFLVPLTWGKFFLPAWRAGLTAARWCFLSMGQLEDNGSSLSRLRWHYCILLALKVHRQRSTHSRKHLFNRLGYRQLHLHSNPRNHHLVCPLLHASLF